MPLLQLFDYNEYMALNKTMVSKLGINEALIFSIMCSKYTEYAKQDKLYFDMVYITIDEFKELTGLSYYKQVKAITNLENEGLVSVVLDGMPAKKYFQIHQNAVFKFFENSGNADFDMESSENSSFQTTLKQPLYNNISNNQFLDNGMDSKEVGKQGIADDRTNDELERLKKELSMPSVTAENKKRAEENGFLGSAKVDNNSGAGRYKQCGALIYYFADNFTKDIEDTERRNMKKKEIQDLLFKYLDMLFEDRNKPVYMNVWRGLLSKLKNVVAQGNEITAVIQQSLDRGYKGFYPINQSFRVSNNFMPLPYEMRGGDDGDGDQDISDKVY